MDSCYLLWATLISPNSTEFSIVAVNTQPDGSADLNISFVLTGSLMGFSGQQIAAWRSDAVAYFSQQVLFLQE